MSPRFIAKMAIRVRVSELNGTDAVTGNGSAFIVTDSKAIARVEVDSLNKTGGVLLAAWSMIELPLIPKRRRIGVIK
jgi:hypothetical protein